MTAHTYSAVKDSRNQRLENRSLLSSTEEQPTRIEKVFQRPDRKIAKNSILGSENETPGKNIEATFHYIQVQKRGQDGYQRDRHAEGLHHRHRLLGERIGVLQIRIDRKIDNRGEGKDLGRPDQTHHDQ